MLRLQLRQAQHDDSSAAHFSLSTARGCPPLSPARVTDRKLCLHPPTAPKWNPLVPAFACGTVVEEGPNQLRPVKARHHMWQRSVARLSYPSYPRFVFLAAADSEDEEGGQAARPDRSSRRHVAARSWSAHPGSFCVPCQAHDFAHEFAAAVRSALAAAMPSFVGLPRAMPPLQQSVERYHKNLSSRSRRPRRRYKDGQRRWQASLQPSR